MIGSTTFPSFANHPPLLVKHVRLTCGNHASEQGCQKEEPDSIIYIYIFMNDDDLPGMKEVSVAIRARDASVACTLDELLVARPSMHKTFQTLRFSINNAQTIRVSAQVFPRFNQLNHMIHSSYFRQNSQINPSLFFHPKAEFWAIWQLRWTRWPIDWGELRCRMRSHP